jgi:Zn-finger protein
MYSDHTIIDKDGQAYAHVECQWCHAEYDVPVILEQVEAWKRGVLIQDAMPSLSKADRELLATGTCNTCFHDIYPDDEEAEGEDALPTKRSDK